MADIRDELEQWRQRRRTFPVDERRERRAVVGAHHLVRTSTTPPLRDEWANGLTALLQNELRIATRRGVISAGECEQLLARLILIIDQALSAD